MNECSSSDNLFHRLANYKTCQDLTLYWCLCWQAGRCRNLRARSAVIRPYASTWSAWPLSGWCYVCFYVGTFVHDAVKTKVTNMPQSQANKLNWWIVIEDCHSGAGKLFQNLGLMTWKALSPEHEGPMTSFCRRCLESIHMTWVFAMFRRGL